MDNWSILWIYYGCQLFLPWCRSALAPGPSCKYSIRLKHWSAINTSCSMRSERRKASVHSWMETVHSGLGFFWIEVSESVCVYLRQNSLNCWFLFLFNAVLAAAPCFHWHSFEFCWFDLSDLPTSIRTSRSTPFGKSFKSQNQSCVCVCVRTPVPVRWWKLRMFLVVADGSPKQWVVDILGHIPMHPPLRCHKMVQLRS